VPVTSVAKLFVRGEESVRLTTLPHALTLLVCGPGRTEQRHGFDTEAALDAVQRAHEEALIAAGWTLHVTSERRFEAAEPPQSERRRRRDGTMNEDDG
jgi:hypothetical protein